MLYAQPPAFGSELAVSLAEGDRTVVGTKVKFTIHDATQLMVAVVAEHPEGIVGNLGLLPNQNQLAPLVMSLTPEDLPERVEAWSALDRVVWQDVDADRLSPAQLEALRGWVAGGGRLVIAGGTAGPKVLGAFPDTLLPYRPVTTTDVPAASLSGILGALPRERDGAAGPVRRADRRPLAGHGRRSGGGRRPALRLGPGDAARLRPDRLAGSWTRGRPRGLWRRLLPARSSSGLSFADDSMLVSAVSQLPSLALPPVGG